MRERYISPTSGFLLALGPAMLSVEISLSATRVGGRIKTNHYFSLKPVGDVLERE
jgi:hypothetical protein